MDSITEKILRYISDQSKNQALLLSGPWGIGKTYYIKNTLQKELERYNAYNKYKIMYISLFGIYSLEQLQRVLGSKFITDGFKKEDLLSKGKYGVSFIGNKLKNIGISVGGIVNINIGISDIVNLENLIDYSNMVLIFDDLERCSSISLQDIFGFINTFTEHKNIPVIVAANEDSLKSIEGYDSIKEKSIYREVAFSSNISDIYSEIVESFNFEKMIKDFLISQFDIYI
jgi:KAP P-loop domain protein, putative